MIEVNIIVAMGADGSIGSSTKDPYHNYYMPWAHCRRDMVHFADQTKGSAVVMGRKTFDLVGPLPGRDNHVFTRKPRKINEWNDVYEFLSVISIDLPTVWVIGGAEIYELFLPVVDSIYITRMHTTDAISDIKFPSLEGWEEQIGSIMHDDCTFEIWNRAEEKTNGK